MIGKILGNRYEIIEEIGKGGMAHVYKARCVLLNRIVALKVLREDLDGGEDFLNRFKSEARAAASLAHSNIVAIFDVGVDNGINYIVMEYVDGITLKEYILKNKFLPYEEVLDIAYQICDALSAAHEKNIVHRDIKPHNILITEDKKIKVTDFGIARFGTGNTLIAGDDILGSVHYISPEQAKGERVDSRSDIYSLGIAMYEMITGKVPFDADTPVAVAMMQIDESPKISPEFEFATPIGLWQMIFKALSKDPDLRYQNAFDFKEDIHNLAEDSYYVLKDGYIYYDSDVNVDDIAYEEDESIDYVESENNVPNKVLIIILAALSSLILVACSTFVVCGGLSDIFSSSDTITVPEFIGKSVVEVEEYCRKNDIKLIIKDGTDSSFEPGMVFLQNPRANSKVDKFNALEITVNKNTAPLELADYKGYYYKDVQNELVSKGYKVNVVFKEDNNTEPDLILYQSPNPGVTVNGDDTITLFVCSRNSFEDESDAEDDDENNDETQQNEEIDESEAQDVNADVDSDKANENNSDTNNSEQTSTANNSSNSNSETSNDNTQVDTSHNGGADQNSNANVDVSTNNTVNTDNTNNGVNNELTSNTDTTTAEQTAQIPAEQPVNTETSAE